MDPFVGKGGSKARLKKQLDARMGLVEKAARDGVDLFAQDIRALFENQFMLSAELDKIDLRTAVMLELISEKLGINQKEFAERYAAVKAAKDARIAALRKEAEEAQQAADDAADTEVEEPPLELPKDMPSELARVAAAGGQAEYPAEAFIWGGKS